MLLKEELTSDKLLLRNITYNDCNDTYLSWLKDERVNKYLETRWVEQTMDSIVGFVNSIRNSDHSILLAIVDIKENYGTHIGNIKIGPINFYNKLADVSYFIGNTNYWNKGYATEAVRLVIQYGFEVLGLHRISAGVIEENIASVKLLQRVGMNKEGHFIDASRTMGGGI